MNDLNTQKIIDIAKRLLDLLIISIFLTIIFVFVAGGINSIFELESAVTFRVGGLRTRGLGNDFGLILKFIGVLLGVEAVLIVLRYSTTIWQWLQPQPWAKWPLAAVTVGAVVLWLVLTLQKTPSERLAIAIGANDVGRVEQVLAADGLEPRYLNLQLSRSIDEGKLDIAAALIEAGADPNIATDYGGYPLMIATIIFGEKESIFFLLEQNIDPDRTDENGQTPLIALIDVRLAQESLSADDLSKEDRVAIVQTLLDLGADPLQTDDFGKSAKDYAEAREYADILVLFP